MINYYGDTDKKPTRYNDIVDRLWNISLGEEYENSEYNGYPICFYIYKLLKEQGWDNPEEILYYCSEEIDSYNLEHSAPAMPWDE